MKLPFEYDQIAVGEFGGTTPTTADFDSAKVVILPVPLDRTTSYVAGTRNGPHEILVASSHMELWDEETGTDVHSIGIYTLPEMEFPQASMDDVMSAIKNVASELVRRDKFIFVLGGEHSITAPIVSAVADKHRGLSVLQIDAHADLRESFMGTPHNHACAMRRVLDYAKTTQVGIRSLSTEEAEAIPSLNTTVFYDFDMRRQPDWIDRVVASLGDPVYITIDCDGLDPAIMPAVGTPEPGGLSWYEMLALLRRVMESRTVVGCDLVELCPMPGNVAPTFLCARLVYKILTYRFGAEIRKRG
ncbi:MAG TPA: agmatinase [Vicinamibacterales bacterium]|nr:agmatinase [Vicinamibacterales bacterium]